MKYAVIQISGKQYKVAEDAVIEVDRLKVEPGTDYTFEKVLLLADEGTVKLGRPTLSEVAVTAKVLDHTKGVKIRVAKFKAKSRYRKVTGHRQALTKLQVTSIKASESKEQKTKIKDKE